MEGAGDTTRLGGSSQGLEVVRITPGDFRPFDKGSRNPRGLSKNRLFIIIRTKYWDDPPSMDGVRTNQQSNKVELQMEDM